MGCPVPAYSIPASISINFARQDAQAIGHCDGRWLLGVLALREREVIGCRCGGYGEGDSARDQRGGGQRLMPSHPVDRAS
jgi:hypothetical protein